MPQALWRHKSERGHNTGGSKFPLSNNMIPNWLANIVLLASLTSTLAVYVWVSRRDGSYVNLMTPNLIITVPAYFLLPFIFGQVLGNDASPFAFIYVYSTITLENIAFAYAYTRPTRKLIRLPFAYSYKNFGWLGFAFLGLAVLMYLPILLEFPEYLLDPRQIYTHTRTGFGISFYTSSTFAYLAVILVQFSEKSRAVKIGVTIGAAIVLSLHGSKGQVLYLVFLIAMLEIYVKNRRVKFLPSLIVGAGIGILGLLLMVATMTLGDGAVEAMEAVSTYSDYTRNAMLVIDSHFPTQYGRLTLESQVIGRIPRVFMPSKPKNYGALYLDDQFFPESFDEDTGAPDFGIGLQYADFGFLAIVCLGAFALLKGWMARVFVSRLRYSHHPGDFVLVAFAAGITLIPVGGIGWLFPETLAIALLLRFASGVGASKVYRETVGFKKPANLRRNSSAADSFGIP